jgi:hypothetical protein
MSTDAVANEVLRQFYLQKLSKIKRKRQSQEVISPVATQEQQETDNPVNAASGDDEQNDSFETSDGLEIGDDFRVLNSSMAQTSLIRHRIACACVSILRPFLEICNAESLITPVAGAYIILKFLL